MKKLYIILVGLFVFACGDDDTVSAEEQFSIDTELIDQYLMENDIDAKTHASGIRYVDDVVGGGISPTINDRVKVKYKGYLLDGTVFDENSQGFTFSLSRLIPAWQIMIPEMKVGGKMTIYAQSGYCYGTRGSGSIGPNESLIFEIELVSLNNVASIM